MDRTLVADREFWSDYLRGIMEAENPAGRNDSIHRRVVEEVIGPLLESRQKLRLKVKEQEEIVENLEAENRGAQAEIRSLVDGR